MTGGGAAVAIIDVMHVHEDGWHKFTSSQIPGLYLIVESRDLEQAYDDIPRAIEELIFVDSGKRVTVRPEKTYSDYYKTLPDSHRPIIRHYSVEPLAA